MLTAYLHSMLISNASISPYIFINSLQFDEKHINVPVFFLGKPFHNTSKSKSSHCA
jgi:hypothetical protein